MELIAKQGGMATTSNFKVTFTDIDYGIKTGRSDPFAPVSPSELEGPDDDLMTFFCDEAQLPSLQIATGEIVGRHMGRGTEYYATSKLNSDFSLGFMCDRQMSQYKFLVNWYQRCLGMRNTSRTITPLSSQSSAANESLRVAYPSEYMGTVKIAKTERRYNDDQGYTSLRYEMYKCFPYAIDAVPLSAGTSQLVKVNAQFYYRRFAFFNDPVDFGINVSKEDLRFNPTVIEQKFEELGPPTAPPPVS
jgi:hypothetical protein